MAKTTIVKKIGEKRKELANKISTFAKINRILLIFETALLLGLAEISFENWLTTLELNIYPKVLIVMLFFGGLFTVSYKLLRPIAKKFVEVVMILKKKKTILILAHIILLILFYYAYALYYFGVALR